QTGTGADDRRQRAAVETTLLALFMEIVVTAIGARRGVAEHAVRANGIHEFRVERQAGAVREISIAPLLQSGPGNLLPQADLGGASRIEDVVIAGEARLTIGGD